MTASLPQNPSLEQLKKQAKALKKFWMVGTALRDWLLDEGPICLFDALDHDRLDRVADILARDPAGLNQPFANCITRPPRPQDAQTPLTRMIERGKTEAVRVLLEHGADVTVRDAEGRTLLQLARAKGFTEIADLLARHGVHE